MLLNNYLSEKTITKYKYIKNTLNIVIVIFLVIICISYEINIVSAKEDLTSSSIEKSEIYIRNICILIRDNNLDSADLNNIIVDINIALNYIMTSKRYLLVEKYELSAANAEIALNILEDLYPKVQSSILIYEQLRQETILTQTIISLISILGSIILGNIWWKYIQKYYDNKFLQNKPEVP